LERESGQVFPFRQKDMALRHLPALGKAAFGDRLRGDLLKTHKERLALILLKDRLVESVRVREQSSTRAISLEN
jgi:hypothetical protein